MSLIKLLKDSGRRSSEIVFESLEGVANERQAHFWDFLTWGTISSGGGGGGCKMRRVVSLINLVGREICRINNR